MASNRNAIVTDFWVAIEKALSPSCLENHLKTGRGAVMQFMELIHKVRVPESGEDSLLWGEKVTFQVKSFYNTSHDENQALFLAKEMWGTYAPSRICPFLLGRLHSGNPCH